MMITVTLRSDNERGGFPYNGVVVKDGIVVHDGPVRDFGDLSEAMIKAAQANERFTRHHGRISC